MRGRPPLANHHGTVGGYRNHGCRCPDCKAARAQASRRYRWRSRSDRTGRATRPTTVDATAVAQASRARAVIARAVTAIGYHLGRATAGLLTWQGWFA